MALTDGSTIFYSHEKNLDGSTQVTASVSLSAFSLFENALDGLVARITSARKRSSIETEQCTRKENKECKKSGCVRACLLQGSLVMMVVGSFIEVKWSFGKMAARHIWYFRARYQTLISRKRRQCGKPSRFALLPSIADMQMQAPFRILMLNTKWVL